jgi:hypothetical protein
MLNILKKDFFLIVEDKKELALLLLLSFLVLCMLLLLLAPAAVSLPPSRLPCKQREGGFRVWIDTAQSTPVREKRKKGKSKESSFFCLSHLSCVLSLGVRLRCLETRTGLLAANTRGGEEEDEEAESAAAAAAAGEGHIRDASTCTTLATSGNALLASLDQSSSDLALSSLPQQSVTSKEEARPFFKSIVREEMEELQEAAAAWTACSSAVALEPYPHPPQYETSRRHACMFEKGVLLLWKTEWATGSVTETIQKTLSFFF